MKTKEETQELIDTLHMNWLADIKQSYGREKAILISGLQDLFDGDLAAELEAEQRVSLKYVHKN